jgi:hypothetical protein
MVHEGSLEGVVGGQQHVADVRGRAVQGDRVRAHPEGATEPVIKGLYSALPAAGDLVLLPCLAKSRADFAQLRYQLPRPGVARVLAGSARSLPIISVALASHASW